MKLSDFKLSPVVQDHFSKVAPHIDALLVTHLIETCRGSGGQPDKAQTEVGAQKAIANLIMIFREANKPSEVKKVRPAKPLHRFADGNSEGAKS